MNKKYYADHKPTGESWVLLGISEKRDLVCVAGWPPTMAKLTDCVNIEEAGDLEEKEVTYRNDNFGSNWD